MNHQSVNTFYFAPPDQEDDQLHLYALEEVLPPCQALVVGIRTRIVTLVSTAASGGNPIVRQRVLTDPELRVLLPLLESPRFCSHEFLSASRTCGFGVLLAGLFAPLPRRGAWLQVVEEQKARLERAREQGHWKKALRDVYYALSDLRGKLRAFGLEVSPMRAGYAITRSGHHVAGPSCSCRQRLVIRHAGGE